MGLPQCDGHAVEDHPLEGRGATEAFFIWIVGAIPVFTAVHVVRRRLECACVGGGGNMPPGFISLPEIGR